MSEADDELTSVFREEARDLFESLTKSLLDSESAQTAEGQQAKIQEMFRLAHTLKGSAAIVGLKEFAEVAHELETHLDRLRRHELTITREFVDVSLRTIDVLKTGLERGFSPADIEQAKAALVGLAAKPLSNQAPAPEPRESAPRPRTVSKTRHKRKAQTEATPPVEPPLTLARRVLETLTTPTGLKVADVEATLRDLEPLVSARGRIVIEALHQALAIEERPAIEAFFVAADFLIADVSVGVSDDELAIVLELLKPTETSPAPVAPMKTPPPQRVTAAQPTGYQTLTPQPQPAPAHAPLTGSAADGWVRVPVSLLDGILYRLDELVAVKLRLDYLRRQVELVQTRVEFAATTGETLDGHSEVRRLEPIRRDLTQEVHVLDLLSQALQDDVKEVRMVTAGPILAPLRRVVRETSLALGKEAVLEVRGEDVRVDKHHFDVMRDPLMHLVRNAVDHGIEQPDERRRLGKPPRGLIEVVVEAHSAHLFIEVRDDGRGLHRDKIMAVAIEKGLVTRERAEALTDREVMNFIFLPGFSTVTKVTELSGRGVGMDVVRDNVSRIGGRIDFYSDPGKGTQFKFSLPLTLSGSRGLMVLAGQQIYCLPLMAVDEVVTIEPGEVHASRDQLAIGWRRQAVQYVALADVLAQRPTDRPTNRCFAVVLALADRRLAVGVEQLLGEEEIVVRGLAVGTPKLSFVVGATTRSDGRLVTVLEPTQLGEAAMGLGARPVRSTGTATRATVLVVDDALTTRTMISSVLERAGYKTLLANDGEAALGVLASENVDLMVSDVEMPLLDGFGLVRRVRSTPKLSSLPVILMTSLDGPADRATGAEAGASAYIVKNTFEPTRFLSMVAEFVGPKGTSA